MVPLEHAVLHEQVPEGLNAPAMRRPGPNGVAHGFRHGHCSRVPAMEKKDPEEDGEGARRNSDERIDPNDAWDVRYWARSLHCSEEELRDAIREVGPLIEDVKLRLEK